MIPGKNDFTGQHFAPLKTEEQTLLKVLFAVGVVTLKQEHEDYLIFGIHSP